MNSYFDVYHAFSPREQAIGVFSSEFSHQPLLLFELGIFHFSPQKMPVMILGVVGFCVEKESRSVSIRTDFKFHFRHYLFLSGTIPTY